MRAPLVALAAIATLALMSPGARAQGKALGFERAFYGFDGQHAHRTTDLRVDPEGDAILIRMTISSWRGGIKRFFGGQQAPLGTGQAISSTLSLSGLELAESGLSGPQDAPLNVDWLVNRLRADIAARGLGASITEEHRWSPSARAYLGALSAGVVPSKLFVLLSTSWVRMYAVTGHEAALKARILTYAARSAQIHDVFNESYVLNGGDLYGTMLTAENVLAADQMSANRQLTQLQKRLAYIRNDAAPTGDNFGAWYHFFGAGLFGLVRSGVVAQSVVRIEDLGSIWFEPADAQEKYMNTLGASFGASLREMLRTRAWTRPVGRGERTDYMTLTGR